MTYFASIGIVVVSISYYFPICLMWNVFGLLTFSSILISLFAVIWVHILLSSTYKTGALVEQVNTEIDVYRNKLMVIQI